MTRTQKPQSKQKVSFVHHSLLWMALIQSRKKTPYTSWNLWKRMLCLSLIYFEEVFFFWIAYSFSPRLVAPVPKSDWLLLHPMKMAVPSLIFHYQKCCIFSQDTFLIFSNSRIPNLKFQTFQIWSCEFWKFSWPWVSRKFHSHSSDESAKLCHLIPNWQISTSKESLTNSSSTKIFDPEKLTLHESLFQEKKWKFFFRGQSQMTCCQAAFSLPSWGGHPSHWSKGSRYDGPPQNPPPPDFECLYLHSACSTFSCSSSSCLLMGRYHPPNLGPCPVPPLSWDPGKSYITLQLWGIAGWWVFTSLTGLEMSYKVKFVINFRITPKALVPNLGIMSQFSRGRRELGAAILKSWVAPPFWKLGRT